MFPFEYYSMIFPLVNSAIADSGALNYMFLFTDISEKASSLIKETDISLLDALITANAVNALYILSYFK